jgi:hypothetical protein
MEVQVEEASTRINMLQHDEISRLQRSSPLGELSAFQICGPICMFQYFIGLENALIVAWNPSLRSALGS